MGQVLCLVSWPDISLPQPEALCSRVLGQADHILLDGSGACRPGALAPSSVSLGEAVFLGLLRLLWNGDEDSQEGCPKTADILDVGHW